MFSKFGTSNIWKKVRDTHGKGNYKLRITGYFRRAQTKHNINKSHVSEKRQGLY